MIASTIVGKADVSYLSADKGQSTYTDACNRAPSALLDAFTALGSVGDKINTFSDDIIESAKALMPPSVAAELADGNQSIDPAANRWRYSRSRTSSPDEMAKTARRRARRGARLEVRTGGASPTRSGLSTSSKAINPGDLR